MTNINQDPSTLTDLLAEINAVDERARVHGRALLGKAFAAFFERCPEVRAIVWAQYAPCVREPEIVPFADKVEPELAEQVAELREDNEDEGDDGLAYAYGEGSMLPWSADSDTYESQKRVRVAFDEMLAAAFDGACESIMRSAFGDDCQVVATRNGFAVDEYSHD